jgi:ribose/xylose/arabinose/galactoside ABC-type transport system permease subunit
MLTVGFVMVVFAWASDGLFLIPDNLLGMLRFMSTIAIVGLGLTVVLVVGEIDLSFAAVYGLSAMSMAVAWIDWGWPLWLAMLLALGIGVAVGAFNAFFTTVVGIPSFIATLGSSTLIFGFNLLISDAQRFAPASPPPGTTIPPGEIEFFRGLSNRDLPFDIPMQVLWMVLIAVVFWVLLSRSLFGFRLRAIGGNATAARFARLPVRRYKLFAFCIVGLTSAVAALLDFAFIGSVQPDGGQSLLFPTFAAVVIGGASLQGGRGSVVGTMLGALLLAVIANGLALLAAGPFAQQMFLGVVTIGAVVLDQVSRTWRRGP